MEGVCQRRNGQKISSSGTSASSSVAQTVSVVCNSTHMVVSASDRAKSCTISFVEQRCIHPDSKRLSLVSSNMQIASSVLLKKSQNPQRGSTLWLLEPPSVFSRTALRGPMNCYYASHCRWGVVSNLYWGPCKQLSLLYLGFKFLVVFLLEFVGELGCMIPVQKAAFGQECLVVNNECL